MLVKTLGEKIKKERTEKGLTGEELGKIIGVSRNAISNWENNRRVPDNETLKKLSQIFDCTTDYLLGLADKKIDEQLVMEQSTQYRTREQNEKIADKLIRILIEKGEIEEGEELSEEKLERLIKKIEMFIDASKL